MNILWLVAKHACSSLHLLAHEAFAKVLFIDFVKVDVINDGLPLLAYTVAKGSLELTLRVIVFAKPIS